MGSRFRHNFRYKITLSYVAIFCLVFSAAAFFILRDVERQVLAELHSSQTRQAKLLGDILAPLFKEGRSPESQERVMRLGGLSGMRMTLIGSSGEVIADSEKDWEGLQHMENHAIRPEVRAALDGQIGESLRYSTSVNTRMLYVALPVLDQGGAFLGVVRVAWPLTHVEEVVRSVQHPISLSFLIGAVLVTVWGIWLGGSLTRRIRILTDTAGRFAQGDLSEKALMDSQDDFAILAKTMNQMAASLSAQICEMDGERRKLYAILSSMSEAVLAVDVSKNILMVNTAAERLFNMKAESAVGKSLIETTRNSQIDEIMSQVLLEQNSVSAEIEWVQAGSQVLRIQAVGISREEGTVAGVMVLADLTELRRLEKNRKEFLANVSHELRTPLTSIQGALETIQQDEKLLPEQRSQFLKMMEEDTVRLRRLVDDLMELSRVESRAVMFHPETLSLDEEVGRALAMFKTPLSDRKIRIENKIPISGKIKIYADRDRLQQVLINLIDNAVKFNQDGGLIMIQASSDTHGTSVSISDTGAGIPRHALDRVFERFYRVDKARSRELGGSGLGLAITKNIVEAQGGNIICESQLGQGSTFRFYLPHPASGKAVSVAT